MKVKLKELRPNPLRDFGVDPLDEEAIRRLRVSISEHGFWGGVVGRQRNGHIEIAAGQHRVESAIREGIEEGEVHVVPGMTDHQLIRIYAEENATQRGQANSTARAGSVAAALRQAAYEALMGNVAGIPATSDRSRQTINGQVVTAKGIGHALIERFLDGVPGITENTIKEDLASLKKSGEYARIIAEVRDRICREQAEAERRAEEARLAVEQAERDTERQEAEQQANEREQEAAAATKAVEKANKAAAKAAEYEPEFDFRGVAPYFKVAHQLQAFRNVVTSALVKDHLPVDQQSTVAAQLVRMAEATGQELTALFIRSTVVEALAQIKGQQRRVSAAEREVLLRADWKKRCSDLQEHYLGALRGVYMYGNRLLDHLETAPKDEPWPVRASYESTLRQALEVIDKVREKL